MATILFGYSSSPCFYEPSDFTTEFKINDKGTLILRIFNDVIKQEFKHKVSLPKPLVADLSNVLAKHQDMIQSLPCHIENNLILDGTNQRFTLSGKTIRTSNIGRLAPDMLKRIKTEEDGKAYHDALLRNQLLEIVAEIYPILKPYGMKVKEWGYFDCDWPPLNKLAAFANDLINGGKICPESSPKYREP